MERIIRKRKMTSLTDNDILSDKQCGFLSKRSTLLQLLKIFDQWTLALDNKVEVDVVYLDFRKAFDSVPHRRLIAVLEQNGVNGKTLNCIKAFLSGRQQRVVVNGTFSTWQNVRSGIPQRSVLGPVLFAIYINSVWSQNFTCLPMTQSSTGKYTQTQIRNYSKMTSESCEAGRVAVYFNSMRKNA